MNSQISTLHDNILQIIKEIKSNRNYENATKIVLDNNISFNDIRQNTFKINIFELAKLADCICKTKGI